MTDLDDLRRTLERHADLAPDGMGIVAAARADVARYRRRRRLATLAGVAAVAVAAAAAVPVVVTSVDRGLVTPAISPTRAYRQPLQLTVDLDPASAYFRLDYGTVGNVQHVTVRSRAGGSDWGAEVAVFDPGRFDASRFQHGEPVVVRGRKASYVTDFLLGRATQPRTVPAPGQSPRMVMSSDLPMQLADVRTSAVGWQDPSGAWVIVYRSANRDNLLRVAEAVRLDTPGQVVAPYRLSYLPDDLPVTFALVRNHDPSLTNSVVAFGGTPTDLAQAARGPDDASLTIQVLNRTEYVDSHTSTPGQAQIAGHDSWYFTNSSSGWGVVDGGAILAVNTDRCQLILSVRDRVRYPYETLKRIVEGADIRDCTNPTTWTTPLA